MKLSDILSENVIVKKKEKKNKKDKTASKWVDHVAGNSVMTSICSGELSGDKK